MTANGEAGTGEHKRKADDSFLKPRGHQGIPRLCTPIRKNLPESLPNDNVIGNEDNDLSRCVTSLAGSGTPSTSYCSMTDSDHIVEELTVKSYKNPSTNLVSYTHNSRQPQRNQLAIESRCNSLNREIVPQAEEHIPFRLSKGLKGIDSEFRGLKSVASKNLNYESLKVSANISNVDKIITSSNGLLLGGTTQNTSYSVSQLIVKQTVKGKGVICKDLDKSISPGGALMSQENETHAFAAKSQSDILLRSNASDNMHSLQGTVKPGTGSSNDGIKLREMLKPEGHKMDKSGRLHIFKQILELVDFAHSQGVVLLDLRPSCFTLLPSGKIKYIGSSGQQELHKVLNCNVTRKRPMEQDTCAYQSLSIKQQKPFEETRSLRQQHHSTCIHGCRTTTVNQTGSNINESVDLEEKYMSVAMQLEEKWYCSPEELNGGVCTFPSNIYSLGVLLLEVRKFFVSPIVSFHKALYCSISTW